MCIVIDTFCIWDGGVGDFDRMTYTFHYQSSLGGITLSSNGTELTGLWLDIYFSGKEPGFTPPLCMQTTQFRKAVWDIILTIPFGETMTYGEIADMIAKQKGMPKMSAQAVGGAVGHNMILLIIPCHRVVGANGSLTGYAGGLQKKIKLLAHEGMDMEQYEVRI